jgi:hypothetical protein
MTIHPSDNRATRQKSEQTSASWWADDIWGLPSCRLRICRVNGLWDLLSPEVRAP